MISVRGARLAFPTSDGAGPFSPVLEFIGNLWLRISYLAEVGPSHV